jgi:hypothetical protein
LLNVPRGGVVNARRPGRWPGRSAAKRIDDAEHGANIRIAMVRCLNLDLERLTFLPGRLATRTNAFFFGL